MEKVHPVQPDVQSGSNPKLKRSLGLFSSIAMLTGAVVGASVFIVPGQIAVSVGPSVWMSYLIGAGLIVFACFTFAQVGSVLPVAGACYRMCATTVNGFWGFLYIWVFAISSVFLFPIMSKTAAQYLGSIIPGVDSLWFAIAVIVITGAMNMYGFAISAKVQAALVIIFVAVILIFSAAGMIHADFSHFEPLLPNGFYPVVVGAISTYYAFAGFNNIIELSGEIKNPRKNIQRTVMISLVLIVILYMAMSISLVGLVPAAELGIDAPAVYAASLVLPKWFGVLIALAAFSAAWTTLNTVMAAMARDVYALAKGGVFPAAWAKLNKFGTPYIGVTVVTVVAILFTGFSFEIMKYVNVSSTYLLGTAVVIAVGSLFIKKKLPKQYEAATFKLKGFWYYFWPVGVIVSSLFFMILAVIDDPFMSLISGILVPVGLLIYLLRKRQYEKRGSSLDASISNSILDEDTDVDGLG
jgi:APA family basic amino acid/polyamine antiporter